VTKLTKLLQGEPYNKPMPTDEKERIRLVEWMIKEGLMEEEGWKQNKSIAWFVPQRAL
jgi:hypothetical protein